MRRRTFGSDLTMSLAWLADPAVVPQEARRHRVVRELETAAQDYGCFTNDLFSHQKEIEFEGELHNLVLVVQRFLGVYRLMARDVVADLMAARMQQFVHILAGGLPASTARSAPRSSDTPPASRAGWRASSSGTGPRTATPGPAQGDGP